MADSGNNGTPLLDELEKGPWPSFVTEIKSMAVDNEMCQDLLGQLEKSYRDKHGSTGSTAASWACWAMEAA